ncbi:FkbM family methyltransferase [Halorubrum sp. SP9]|uniref:FkbM family methyltransferase n=1 Tax=Halorubrum sp. SP9 TaxID=1537267 RepID=UPI001A7E0952|nr:FkbM family methyltransferase [Halorubrum sp. SP9]
MDATDEFPEYEAALLEGIRSSVESNNTVVVVGGGRGVSSVVAARQSAPNGHVTTYEGGAERVRVARETAVLSRVADSVSIEHGIIGSGIDIAGDGSDAISLEPDALPECDTLILDCEGAELEILESLDQRPQSIIVETHAFLDSPESAVRTKLDDIGYTIVNRGVELDEKGVYVLTAVRSEDK